MKRLIAIMAVVGVFTISAAVAGGFAKAGWQEGRVYSGLSFATTNNDSTAIRVLSSITVSTDGSEFGGSNVSCWLQHKTSTQELFRISCTNTAYWDANDSIPVSRGDVFLFYTPYYSNVNFSINIKDAD